MSGSLGSSQAGSSLCCCCLAAAATQLLLLADCRAAAAAAQPSSDSNSPVTLPCSYDTPLVADIHFQPKVAMMVAEAFEKIRINPGQCGEGCEMCQLLCCQSACCS